MIALRANARVITAEFDDRNPIYILEITLRSSLYMGKHSFADNILLDVNATGNLESPRSIVGV